MLTNTQTTTPTDEQLAGIYTLLAWGTYLFAAVVVLFM